MIAEIIPEISIGKRLDYLIPKELEEILLPGCWVSIPMRGREIGGYVAAIKETSPHTNLRFISEMKSKGPVLTKDLLALALWISEYYYAPIEKTLRCMLPTGVRKGTSVKTQHWVVRAKTKEILLEACKSLLQKAPLQSKALEHMLKVRNGIFLTELIEQAQCSKETIKALVDKGFLALEKVRSDTSLLQNEEYFFTKAKALRPEQQKALSSITNSLGSFTVKLLYGVTGSGKTEVYMQAIEKALEQGRSILMLVPEISLTSQTIQRFKSRFPIPLAVLHHRLSDGERQQAWDDCKAGRARIVIGARSAIFCPLPNLGLIIVDEEHEGSYKQTDDSPTYHARDVAIMRGKISQATVVLGSATPSLESMHNAKRGKYELLSLLERSDATLPTVHIVDMAREYEIAQCRTPFSTTLLQKIDERCKAGEQTILFLNRRGYYTTCLCSACSKAISCTHCDTTLTFHKNADLLICHLCGTEVSPPRSCPHCRKEKMMRYKGLGTEKVEAMLHAIFPDIRTVRADADTTAHKGSLEKLLHHFRSGKADILIGTQMIAKGLHFPEVTLVGILNCDSSMQIPDFRAQEMVFQLIVQVAGRAGRGLQKGEVVLQTALPSHPVIVHASRQDFMAFHEEELSLRCMFGFPPYTHIIKLVCSSSNQTEAEQTLNDWVGRIQAKLPENYICHPPVQAGHAKVKDIFRFQALVRGPSTKTIAQALDAVEAELAPTSGVHRHIDVDPLSTFF